MSDVSQDEMEQAYINGSQMAWQHMLGHCLRGLGVNDPEAGKARWVSERASAISTLRSVCAEFGDNEWSDNLHLSDVIEKHLIRHIAGRLAELEGHGE